MAPAPQWDLNRYAALLRLQVRQMQLNPRLRRRFDSSDVVQEAMARACARLSDCKATTEAELMGWLCEIVSNTAKDMIRREKAAKRDLDRERRLDDLIAGSSAGLMAFVAADQSTPSQQAAREEQLLRLAKAIDQLPADQRDVVLQRHTLGLSVAAIAAGMERTEKAVAGLLLRGRRRLRELLAEDE